MTDRAVSAFLPAALEIEETPPSPVGRAILWSILCLFCLAVLWAIVGKVDIVAVAQGRIIASGYSKTLQPLEKGAVSRIHVGEGQAVEAGDVLIELDPGIVQADVERHSKEYADAGRHVARFSRLLEWSTRSEPPTLEEMEAAGDPVLPRLWEEHTGRLLVLQQDRELKLAERSSAQRQVEKLQALLPLVTRRAQGQKGLAEQKLLPEQQYLETEQERLGVRHDLLVQQGRMAELDASIAHLEAHIDASRREFRRKIAEELEQAENRHSVSGQELIKAETRARSLIITAPVDGIVQQLSVHHVGAVVTPTQTLMVIVPSSETLEVEAFLENKDIGFVEVGQTAEVKIDAFPFTRYGTIEGRIVGLSDDAIPDERRGLVYKLRVRLQRARIDVDGKVLPLSPGMTVSVESRTGTRRLIGYFLSPLLRYRDESVRER